MKKIFTILILVVLLGAGCNNQNSNQKISTSISEPIEIKAETVKVKKVTSPSFKIYDMGVLSEDIVNCEFKVLSNFIYENLEDSLNDTGRKVGYETVEQETPVLLTFAGLSTDNPIMKGNNGNSQLIKIKNDDESIILAEENIFGDLFLYTIFKKEKVAVWSKAYKLINKPYAHLSMGYCY